MRRLGILKRKRKHKTHDPLFIFEPQLRCIFHDRTTTPPPLKREGQAPQQVHYGDLVDIDDRWDGRDGVRRVLLSGRKFVVYSTSNNKMSTATKAKWELTLFIIGIVATVVCFTVDKMMILKFALVLGYWAMWFYYKRKASL